jgi:hypothetical protein
VAAPITLCNPVEKTVGRKTARITNPFSHLVLYPIKKAKVKRLVVVRNQFGIQVLEVIERHSLALPSYKTNCSEYAEKTKIALQSGGQQIAQVNQAIHAPYQGDPNGDCP